MREKRDAEKWPRRQGGAEHGGVGQVQCLEIFKLRHIAGRIAWSHANVLLGAGKQRGAIMQCLACRADNKMLLIDVVADDTTKEPVIERKTYMCSECRHIARRLVFKRVKMPITHLPVIPIPIDKLWNGRVAAPRTWAKAVEKLRSRQIDLKKRTAAAKIAGWTTAVEKVRSKQAGLAEQAAVASRVKLAEPVQASEARSAVCTEN